ncbi:hypothetical protein [Piscinibacter terrae]|uniref:Uncharacterized protein n=1 Tax=Piscinibacter terrae TaxID=2496871 RepID=A0A3N7HHA2_9BURK|nr:hypothetical protein [Albitalea terrae]RQP21417.1 hypothetical protein DZC73_28480 [Albitalea terrae]
MRRLLALIALVPMLAWAGPYENAIEVQFPDKIADFTYGERHEFPQRGLGVNLRYSMDGPVVGSIYIYNGGLGNIPSGVDAAVVRRHFAQVISEVKQMEALGKVRAVKFNRGSEAVTAYAGCGPQFIWQGYEMELDEANAMSSFTYLTAYRNNFIKLRISYPRGLDKGDQQVERFVRGLRQVLGGCERTV